MGFLIGSLGSLIDFEIFDGFEGLGGEEFLFGHGLVWVWKKDG